MTNLEKMKKYGSSYGVSVKIPDFGSSTFQERLLRFGTEYRDNGCESAFDKKTVNLIIESLAADAVKRIEKTQLMFPKDRADKTIVRILGEW